MGKKTKLCVLNNVLWVPSQYVDDDARKDFTYKFEEVEYHPNLDLPSKCSNCELWGKKWRPGRTTCKQKGYTIEDVCKHFSPKKVPVSKEIVVKTYQDRPDGWTTFARGDIGKIKKHFARLGVSDERVAPKLEFDLTCLRELYPEQQKVAEDWLSKKYGIIQAPTGWGKCLGKGTPILLYDGSVIPVEKVVVGDLLMGPDSQPRRVTSTCRGVEPLYRVTPVKGDPYVVNESHILSLKLTRSKPSDEVVQVNIPVKEYLQKSKWFKHRAKGWRTGVEFPKTKLNKDMPPYVLGMWLGDGATNRMKNSLRSLGVLGNKHIPHEYKTASREDRLQLLAGLIDSDSSRNAECYDFISKHERLADDLCFVARSVGLAAYKKPCIKTCSNNGVSGTYYRVHLSGNCSIIPCRIPRKKATPRYRRKDHLVVGIQVDPIGEGEYYGFEVEGPDRLFLLGDFTVTHNTVCWSWLVSHLNLKTLLLAQEVRHLMVGFEGLYEHTNIAELEEEAGEHLIGILNKDWKWVVDSDGTKKRKWMTRKGKFYPITFATFQSFASKGGKKLRRQLKDEFGLLWAEECLSGDTLVPTVERGLIRLDEFVEDASQNQDISIHVGTRFGVSKARRWIRKSAQPTVKITTRLGNSVTATLDHKMLVLDPVRYELEWVRSEDLKEGDLLCVSPEPAVRKTPLPLVLPAEAELSRTEVRRPTTMTPDLAFLLACVVTEGGVYQNSRVEITNTNMTLLDSYASKMESVFGLKPRVSLQYPKGTRVDIRGKSYLSSMDCYVSSTCSKTLALWLQSLGISTDNAPSKVVPWSILQADEESQLAFLAGFLECDGFIAASGYIGFCSSSITLLHQLQAVLFAHGVTSAEIKKPDKERDQYYIRVSGSDSENLYRKISPWLVTKSLPEVKRRSSKLYGIPASGIVDLLQDRRVQGTGRCTFRNDDNKEVTVPRIPREFLYPLSSVRGPQKTLPYETISRGGYDELISKITLVSESMGNKLKMLANLGYRYVPVTSVENAGVREVFDLTLEDTQNRSFVANGLISSNCHHESAPTFHAATRSFNAKYRGGQTATPSRKDQTHVAIFDTLGPVTAKGTKEAMTPIVHFHASNVLVPDRIFRGKYIIPQLVNFLARNAAYQECLYEEILKECEEGRKILVVTERRNHAFRLKQKLNVQGFGCELIIGGQEMKDQNWYAEELLSGRVSVLIGTQVINENVNIPPLDSIHQPFPNFGKEREEQRVGRVRRYLSGSNYEYLKENGIEWDKPQPRVHVYTWHATHNMAESSVGFRDRLYKKWGFDFAQSYESLPKTKRAKTMKEWLKSFEENDKTNPRDI